MAQANCVPSAGRAHITGAASIPSTNSVPAAYAGLLERFTQNPPVPIPILVRRINFAERANHARELLTALSDYLGALLEDTAASVPGGLDLRQIEALLCDLTSEVTGALVNAESVAEVVP